MFQIQVPIGRMPVNLVLVGDRATANVVFVKVGPVGAIFDTDEDQNIRAAFYEEDFDIFGKDGAGEVMLKYNTMYEYKQMPVMLEWLQAQNLQEPQNIIFG